jgi:CBS domain-containing protein
MILSYASREVITARADDSVRDVVGLMEYYNVGCVVVVFHERPVGIVTDRDLALRALGTWKDGPPSEARISEFMTRPVQTIREDEGFDKALEVMRTWGVRRLPVVDRQGRLRGLVTLDDIFHELCRDMDAVSQIVRRQHRLPLRRRAVEGASPRS